MALERHVATTHDILQSWRATREDVWLPNHLDPGQLVVFPRLQIKDTEHFARDLLQREGLMTVPGELFGLPGHIRIGLGMPAAKLAAGLEVLGRALDDHDDLT